MIETYRLHLRHLISTTSPRSQVSPCGSFAKVSVHMQTILFDFCCVAPDCLFNCFGTLFFSKLDFKKKAAGQIMCFRYRQVTRHFFLCNTHFLFALLIEDTNMLKNCQYARVKIIVKIRNFTCFCIASAINTCSISS